MQKSSVAKAGSPY